MEQESFLARIKDSLIAKFLLLFLIILVMVIVADKVVMPMYVHLGDETELPEVVEMPVDEALAKLEKLGFTGQIVDSVYNATLSKGTVVEQIPYPFTRVKEGRRVYLTVCMGKKPILMPNLFYKSPREAEEILKSYGLNLKASYYEYSDFAVDGVVIGQSYPQGQEVKKGTDITLTISLGPFPVEKSVPDIVGQSLVSARKQLHAVGVKNVRVEYEERENMLPETVLSQNVKPGVAVSDNMEVILTVSKLKMDENNE